MKYLILTLFISLPLFATESCNVGVPQNLPIRSIQALQMKGYRVIPLESIEENDYYLSYHRDQRVGRISGFFCTTQYAEVTLRLKAAHDVAVKTVSFSSCNDSSVIYNMNKKEAQAFKKFPDCQNSKN